MIYVMTSVVGERGRWGRELLVELVRAGVRVRAVWMDPYVQRYMVPEDEVHELLEVAGRVSPEPGRCMIRVGALGQCASLGPDVGMPLSVAYVTAAPDRLPPFAELTLRRFTRTWVSDEDLLVRLEATGVKNARLVGLGVYSSALAEVLAVGGEQQ